MEQKPRSRKQNITGTATDVHKRGEGLGTGPVGSKDGYQGRGSGSSSSDRGAGASGQRASGGGSLLAALLGKILKKPKLLLVILAIVAVVVLLYFVFSGAQSGSAGDTVSLNSGTTPQSAPAQSSSAQNIPAQSSDSQNAPAQSSSAQNTPAQSSSGFSLSSLFGGTGTASNASSGWTREANTGKLDTAVAEGSRAKQTEILGGGKDTVTLMVYMCGADLESKYGMGTSDLQEMLGATLSDKINLIVYTGGAKTWKNDVVSNKVSQIYKVENGKLLTLESDLGDTVMTDPNTLSYFIQYCAKKYPANRNMLVFWDHGGGSLTGYGYDEKHSSAGSMGLNGIGKALKAGGVTFDFVGFDACLMATVETALTLTPYADYLIGSEETEPGVGWYYTNWLTKFAADTSMPTVEIGKNIADDFVSVCAQKCRGQATTLSVIDLAELEHTVPEQLKSFAASTTELLQESSYKTVSNARSGAREFAASSRIDQVDLTSLAYRLGTPEAESLAKTLLGAVKYNRTSSDMTDAYGLSIYFPYQKTSKVDSAVSTYAALGMDSSYSDCIRKFASLETGGQAAAGGSSSAFSALSGSGSSSSGIDVLSLLGSLLGGRSLNIDGLNEDNTDYLGDLDVEKDGAYLSENRFNADALVWLSGEDGSPCITLDENQWALVQNLERNVFLDDGEGYIDLGLDNTFKLTEDGVLCGSAENTWLAIDGNVVSYYLMYTVDDGETYSITGRVPALLNGERVNLILIFDSDNENGYIAGAEPVYKNAETETVAKNLMPLQNGDKLDFLCDYYTYAGEYSDTYKLGEQMTVSGTPVISDLILNTGKTDTCYRFTDIYNNQFWTPAVESAAK